MARLAVKGEELIVELAWWEKITARHTDVRVPLAAVEKVTVDRDWRRAVRGEPSRGAWIADLLYLGVRDVREQADVRDFVAIRPRRGPVARVDLRPAASPFARVAVTDRVPETTAATVRTAVSHHLLAPAASGCADPDPAPRRRPAWLPGRSPAPAPPAGI